MSAQKIIYMLLHFPYLTETFVAEEIRALRSQGLDVRIVSLLEPGPGPVQTLSQQLQRYVDYAPGLVSPTLWQAQLYYLLKSPRLYVGLLARLLRQPCPRQRLTLLTKRLVIFLKAVAVAYSLRNDDVRLLHAHFAWLSGAAAWVSARLLNLPFTVTVHAYDIYYSNDLLPLVSSQANRIVAISEYNRQQVAAASTCPIDNIAVIHCGVDLALFQEHPTIERPDDGPIRILSIGSLVPKKGHTHLIAACNLLKQRGKDFACTIIGGGPEESALRQQIQSSGLQDQVNLMGALPHAEIMDAFRQHDLFALAAVVAPGGDRDGIPVVLMEAGALGLPLISTKVSGIPELVRHDQTGWLAPPGDPTALADAISVLAADSELRARLGRNARLLVESEFSVESNAARLATLFEAL